MNIKHEIQANEVLSRVQKLLESQTAKGIEKYGHTVNVDELTTKEWVQHAKEEIVDLLVYLTILEMKLESSTNRSE